MTSLANWTAGLNVSSALIPTLTILNSSLTVDTRPHFQVDDYLSVLQTSPDFGGKEQAMDEVIPKGKRRFQLRHPLRHRRSRARKTSRSVQPNLNHDRGRQLYAKSGNSFLEVDSDGNVKTSFHNSTSSVMEIIFACHLAQLTSLVGPCPIFNTNSNVFATVLLYFTNSSRYLCMNETGMYTLRRQQNNDKLKDCLFRQEILGDNDAFRSARYPMETDRCVRHRHNNIRNQTTQSQKKTRTSIYCNQQWYIGVNPKGRVIKVAVSSGTNKTDPRTVFIHKKINEGMGQNHHDAIMKFTYPLQGLFNSTSKHARTEEFPAVKHSQGQSQKSQKSKSSSPDRPMFGRISGVGGGMMKSSAGNGKKTEKKKCKPSLLKFCN